MKWVCWCLWKYPAKGFFPYRLRILAWQHHVGLPCCWCHESSSFRAAGTITEMTFLVMRGREMALPAFHSFPNGFHSATPSAAAGGQLSFQGPKCQPLNCGAGSTTLMLLSFFFFLFFLSSIVYNNCSNRCESKGLDPQLSQLTQ